MREEGVEQEKLSMKREENRIRNGQRGFGGWQMGSRKGGVARYTQLGD